MKNRTWELVLVIAFLLIGGGLRFAGIDSIPPGLWYDEARNSLELARWVEEFRPRLGDFCGEPLYGVPGTAVALLRGIDERTLRITSALIGTASIPVLWWTLGRTWGSSVGLLGAFFLAVSQWHVVFSRIGFRGILLPLMICLSVWAFERAWRQSRRRDWILLGIVLSVGWYSYIPFKIMPVLVIVLAFLRSRRRGESDELRQSRKRGAIRVAIILLLFLLPWFYQTTKGGGFLHARVREEQIAEGRVSALLGNTARALGMFVWQGNTNPRHNVIGAPCIPRFLFPFFVLGMLRSLTDIRRSVKSQTLWIILIGFLLPSFLSRGAPHSLRSIGVIVPMIVFWADGVRLIRAWLLRRGPRLLASKTMIRSLAALGGCVMVAWTIHFYFHRYAKQPEIEHAFQSRHFWLAKRARALPDDHLVLFDPIRYGRTTVQFMMRNRLGPTFLDRIPDYPGLEVPPGGVDVYFFDKSTVERHFAGNAVETYVTGDDEYFCTRVHLSPEDGTRFVNLAYKYF